MRKYTKQLEQKIKEDLCTMVDSDVEMEYGIQIMPDKSVYDIVSDRIYPNIESWVDVYLDESCEEVERIGSKGAFDDGYY